MELTPAHRCYNRRWNENKEGCYLKLVVKDKWVGAVGQDMVQQNTEGERQISPRHGLYDGEGGSIGTEELVTTDKFEVGNRAYDPEGDEEQEVIVVDTPAVRAKDLLIPATGETVAEYNEGCPEASPDDLVVEVVFTESLDASLGTGKWTTEEVVEMYGDGSIDEYVTRYAYPDGRLNTEPSDASEVD